MKKYTILVIWANTEYNIGNAFDETTGIFTCPYDGIYSFYATSSVYNSNRGSIYIFVNGSNKLYHYTNVASSKFAHISPNGVVKLKQGDTVHIYMSGTFHNAKSVCTETYFQGHLIDLL